MCRVYTLAAKVKKDLQTMYHFIETNYGENRFFPHQMEPAREEIEHWMHIFTTERVSASVNRGCSTCQACDGSDSSHFGFIVEFSYNKVKCK